MPKDPVLFDDPDTKEIFVDHLHQLSCDGHVAKVVLAVLRQSDDPPVFRVAARLVLTPRVIESLARELTNLHARLSKSKPRAA